jgi:hypothetical protein
MWRRVPITTATVALIIGFWLYNYVSVSSAATPSTPRPVLAAAVVPPLATGWLSTQSLRETQTPETVNPAKQNRTRRTRHSPSRTPGQTKNSRSAFRRKKVGEDEVDYVAQDVTIRLFMPGPTPKAMPAARLGRERHIGKDVTVRYFEREPGTEKRPTGSALAQSTER